MHRITTALVASMLAAAAAYASAQVTVQMPTSGELKATLELRGDVQRGKEAYGECQSCHRRDGSGRVNGLIPRLSGQHASVLIKQMMDIRSGARINPDMKDYVVDPALTLQNFADIAAYLQSLPLAGNIGRGPSELVPRGKDLFTRDCVSCHGEQGQGSPELFHPMVASQHHGYLARELKSIRDGRRGNSNPAMAAILKGYSPDDLLAVAAYMAQLPPPARP